MKLIFASGQEVDLPGALYVQQGQFMHDFYDKRGEGRRWLYSVSASMPFILVAGQASDYALTPETALRYVADHLHEYRGDEHRADLNYIRSTLWNDYRARSGWKETAEESEEGQP